MDAYKETFESWNKLAALYEEKFMHLKIYDDSYDFICEAIPEANASLLEVGCGPGNITRYLLSKRSDYRITGIDIAPAMIELARKNNPAAEFFVMDSRDIHILDSKYKGIICGFCIPYLSPADVEKLITDASQLLLEEGLLYISFVDGDPARSGYQSSGTGHKTYFYFHQIDTLILLMLKNEFEVIRQFNVEYRNSEGVTSVHTILTARKRR